MRIPAQHRQTFDVLLQSRNALRVVAAPSRWNFGDEFCLKRAFDLGSRDGRLFDAGVGDEIDAVRRDAEAFEVGEHRLRAGYAEQRRLEHDKEAACAGHKRSGCGGIRLRCIHDDLVEGAEIGDQPFDFFLVERISRVVAIGQFEQRHAVGTHRRDSVAHAGAVQKPDRLAQHGNAAAPRQVGIDQRDAMFFTHSARQLAADRRRAGAALSADEEGERQAR